MPENMSSRLTDHFLADNDIKFTLISNFQLLKVEQYYQ
jgi:hypothetical protein